MRDGADEQPPLLFGGVALGQRAAQAIRHASQRRADLGNLARTRADRGDVEVASGDPLRVGGEHREGPDDPPPQQDHARDEREGEREQAGRARGRESHRTARTGDEQRAGQRFAADLVGLEALLELELAARLGERRGQLLRDERLAGHGGLRWHVGLGGDAREHWLTHLLELRLHVELGQPVEHAGARGRIVQVRAGLREERRGLANARVDAGLLAGADGQPRRARDHRRDDDRDGEGKRQQGAERKAARAAHRPSGGSKR